MTEPVQLPEFVFQPLEAFAAIDEPGAEPLASTHAGGVVVPARGIVLVFGTGGAGKTTLVIDLCFALAAGEPWLGLVTAARPLRIALVENEGPRPEFRRKLRRKLAASGRQLDGRIIALEQPWAELSFADDSHRRALALAIVEHELDLVVVGPLVSAGEFPNGGTPEEIKHFETHVRHLRDLADRPFAIVLVHHENRAGQVSGAWERLPDTLMHITALGNGRTRIRWAKARWASDLHDTSTHLIWADGETYTVERKPEVTEDTMADDVLTAVRENPGASWTKIRDLQAVRGKALDLAKTRDRLIAAGEIVNSAAREGHFTLWLPDDPACPRSLAGTGWERLAFPPEAEASDTVPFPVPPFYRNGDGNGTGPAGPQLDENELERLEAIANDFGLAGDES